MTPTRRLRMGMVGGGEGSFIGALHRTAARMDGLIEIVAGALSRDADKARRSGAAIGLAPERAYASFDEMYARERERADRIDFVTIVTPNHRHFEPAKKALEAGFDVVIDKPLCFSVAEARELRTLVAKTGRKLCLTHTYAGYPAMIEARELVRAGRLGRLRKVVVQYPQGWLATRIEAQGQKQASWRADPMQSGQSGCFGDIGTHAVHLAEFVSQQRVTSVLAELQTYIEGRALDDDATVLLRFNDGLRGVALASQVSTGEDNALKISLYGENGGLHWTHAQPNHLELHLAGEPRQTLVMGADKAYLSELTRQNLRTPSGHPEGFLEAFANLYRNFATGGDYPTVEDGFRGMALIDAVVKSSQAGSVWTKTEETS